MKQRHNAYPDRPASLNRLAFTATAHCLAGCSIGEVIGMIAGVVLRWDTMPTIAVSVVLAFLFGYAFTVFPLFRSGLPLATTLRLTLAADTFSIIIMEIVDNGIMLIVPGAMAAELDQPVFWISLAGSLALAGLAAFPLNRWLITRGRGHAIVHGQHTVPGGPSEDHRMLHNGHND